MTDTTRRKLLRTAAMLFDAIALAAILIALYAWARGEDTRNTADHTARQQATLAHQLAERTHKIAVQGRSFAVQVCVADNGRWNTYLATVRAVSDKRSEGESMQDWRARQRRTDRILDAIKQSVTVHCKEVFK